MQLNKYLPSIYNNVYELQKICEIEQPEANNLETEFQLAFDRQFVLSADDKGLAQYEQLLELPRIITDTIQDRRDKIILKLSNILPFTLPYLKSQLDKIMGVGNYQCWVNYNEYKLYVSGLLTNDDWTFTLNSLIYQIKPANIVYVYQPLLVQGFAMNEEIIAGATEWRYKLGNWRLGQYSFLAVELGVVKLATTSSIKPALLNRTAAEVKKLIDHIKLNDGIIVTEFNIFEVNNNQIVIDFLVPPTEDTKITHLEVTAEDNTVLTSSDFSVVLGEATEFRITISIVEGGGN